MKYLLGTLLLLAGCSSQKQQTPTVIAEVGGEGGNEGPRPALVDRILGDEKRAAEIIRQTIAQKNDPETATLAAVYAKRLGIRHDVAAATQSLLFGIRSEDPLLSALSWRWLAAGDDLPCAIALPPTPLPTDPVVATLMSVALSRCESLPRELEDRWGVPKGVPVANKTPEDTKKRTEHLIALSAPYDNGPLALTLAFVEAQRNEWGEAEGEGKPQWVAKRLRDELLALLVQGNPDVAKKLKGSPAPKSVGLSSIFQRLESPLITQKRTALYGAILGGGADLKIAALRTIATVAREPQPQDFGAAASCLTSRNIKVRLESARTFLLMSKRAR